MEKDKRKSRIKKRFSSFLFQTKTH